MDTVQGLTDFLEAVNVDIPRGQNVRGEKRVTLTHREETNVTANDTTMGHVRTQDGALPKMDIRNIRKES